MNKWMGGKLRTSGRGFLRRALHSTNPLWLAIVASLGSLAVTILGSVTTYDERAADYDAHYRGLAIDNGWFAGSIGEDTRWTLAEGEVIGSVFPLHRVYRLPVRYTTNFSQAPQDILVTINRFAASSETKSLNMTVGVEKKSIAGCEIVIETWGDTKVFWVEGGWLAYQAAPAAG